MVPSSVTVSIISSLLSLFLLYLRGTQEFQGVMIEFATPTSCLKCFFEALELQNAPPEGVNVLCPSLLQAFCSWYGAGVETTVLQPQGQLVVL